MKWHVIKYLIAGKILYAIEDDTGYIYKYCTTLPRALKLAGEMSD